MSIVAKPPGSDEAAGREAAAAAGLVTSPTTDTGSLCFIDKVLSRLRRMNTGVLTFARIMQEGLTSGGCRFRAAMVTLTYRPGVEWAPEHVSQYLKLVREHLRRRGHALRYTWVLELQLRGAPHYHVVFWLPRGLTLPKPDKAGHWKHGSTRIEWAQKPVGYLAKYASKIESKGGVFPRGARIWGGGGLPSLSCRHEFRWWRLPKFMRELVGVGVKVARRRGGGWLNCETGELHESGWRLCRVGKHGVHLVYMPVAPPRRAIVDGLQLVRLVEHERECHAAGMRQLYERDRIEWVTRIASTLEGRDAGVASAAQCPF